MLFSYIFLVVCSLGNFLPDFHVSGSEENCPEKPVFSPTRVVVKHGDKTSATCHACRSPCDKTSVGLEIPIGTSTSNGTMVHWKVDRVSEWDVNILCYYNDGSDNQCSSQLPFTVYQPPDNVSLSIDAPSGPLFEGRQYTLQCEVQNVAPVQNLSVTFYKGQTVLGQLQSNNTGKKPVTEIFKLSIVPSREDDEAQYWCEAKLVLGPGGPPHPPVVTSQKLNATVNYKPWFKEQLPLNFTVTQGDPLQLTCGVVGKPRPSYTWKFPPDSLLLSDSQNHTIKSVGPEHGGQYTCFARNDIGEAHQNFTVIVKANNTPYLIAGVLIGFLVITVMIVGFLYHYQQNRMGKYRLKDVFRRNTYLVALPTGEQGGREV